MDGRSLINICVCLTVLISLGTLKISIKPENLNPKPERLYTEVNHPICADSQLMSCSESHKFRCFIPGGQHDASMQSTATTDK